jgi:uncharacterized protein (DUF2342 family)
MWVAARALPGGSYVSRIARLVVFSKVTLLMLCVAAMTALAGHVEIALVGALAAFVVPHLDALNDRIARRHSSAGLVDQDESGQGVVFDYRLRSRSWRTVAAVAITAGLAG